MAGGIAIVVVLGLIAAARAKFGDKAYENAVLWFFGGVVGLLVIFVLAAKLGALD